MIKFYSEESADFVMLDSSAAQLLTMMGYGGSTEGAVNGATLATAQERLIAAIAREQDNPASANPDEQSGSDDWSEDEDSDEPEAVTVSARTAPLIAMLRRASDADGYVMWRSA
ncbi:DUF1840 family protein [Gilvimarinus polysaccharolyticus]|uniref:DUF1840 family protein n=1 Tax=Gilvimarinus polysaccharolyticus TaxID=863921 RepID=UPI000673A1F6|nr:DUF1840 family protein [Gilvimarinus polysaccharolyticus]